MFNRDLGSASMSLCEKAFGNYQNKIDNKSVELKNYVGKLSSINSLLQKLQEQENKNVIEFNNLSDKENEILASLNINQRSFSVQEAKNLTSTLERTYLTINQVELPGIQRELNKDMETQNLVVKLQSKILETIRDLYRSFNRKLHQ